MWSRLTVGGGFGREDAGGHRGELLRRQPDPDLRQQPEVACLERHRPRIAAQRTGLQFGEKRRDLLIGAVAKSRANSRSLRLEHVVVDLGVVDASA